MSTDLNMILALKRELDIFADNLREAKTKLIRHKESLDAVWNANEISMIDATLEEIDFKLGRVADELNDIASDVLKAHLQIEEERITRERLEREDQERLAQERQAREREEQERLARERQAREREEQERLAREQEAREQAAREQKKAEQEKSQNEQEAQKENDFISGFFSWLFRR